MVRRRRNKLTDIDALKLGYNWSPDSKEIAFSSSDNNLRKLTVATKQVAELDTSRYGGFGAPSLVARRKVDRLFEARYLAHD